MEDWVEALETVTNGIEQFFEDFGKGMGEAVDALIEFADEMAEELERTVSPGLDQFDYHLNEWIEPIVLALTGLEATIDRAVEPVTQTVDPLLNQHPVCVGCRHYHGHAYNGVMFICAMHPYGIVDGSETCPDKEPTVWMLPSDARSANSANDIF